MGKAAHRRLGVQDLQRIRTNQPPCMSHNGVQRREMAGTLKTIKVRTEEAAIIAGHTQRVLTDTGGPRDLERDCLFF